MFHLLLHVLVPGAVARLAFPRRWLAAWGVMIATLAVDADHLFATPIYDPDRCSIGYHPLHTWPAILLYMALSAVPRTRLVGVGLLVHMALDVLDCLPCG